MTFLPIVQRELRTAARRRHTYWTRFFAALSTLALCTWIWGWLLDRVPGHERGQILFQVISGLAFVYSLLSGISITADCLSEEKREGTLGLLFLTDLKGYDVVLGKLAATSLNVLYRLLSVFPILAIPMLLGGLALGEFWRMVLVLANTLFFSLSAGMVASAAVVRDRVAMTSAFLLILLVTAGPPLVGLGLFFKHRATAYPREYLLSSAVYPAVLALERAYRVRPNEFWAAVATTHILGWGFLGAASVLVQHTWQERPLAGRRALWRERWRNWQFGHGAVRKAMRHNLLDRNPVLWLNARDRLRPVYLWGILLGLGLIWAGFYWRHRTSLLDLSFYVLTVYSLQTVVKLWVASEACRPLSEDRRTGALELLLSTPLSVGQILDGHILGFERQFARPVLLVLLADLVLLAAGLSADGSNDWLLLCASLIVLFVVDLYTLAWVGLWLSLTSKKSNRAVNGTIARVLVLPWAVLILGLTLLTTLHTLWTPPWQNFEPGEMGLLLIAFIVGLVNAAVFFFWAKTNLHEKFRLAATQRFDLPGSPDPAPVELAESGEGQTITPGALTR